MVVFESKFAQTGAQYKDIVDYKFCLLILVKESHQLAMLGLGLFKINSSLMLK